MTLEFFLACQFVILPFYGMFWLGIRAERQRHQRNIQYSMELLKNVSWIHGSRL